ncbi:hypothetical protein [Alkaliphilus hydrothermalis]|uniref:DUF4367 domain-containing protein n=1 Tax=Alkaliphilus hydrothermalis TaxID=1482730 RepID=A0ABS2NLK6_9FIRM|nr:hypothetical protein [Alkaliphilus hydrothermalis]MBM7613813.1 hypothetical protein [Alkaliphilus hydrothermalis]
MNNRLNKHTDEEIKDSLMKQTDASIEMKNEIWSRIEKRINEDNENLEKSEVTINNEKETDKQLRNNEEQIYNRRARKNNVVEEINTVQSRSNLRKGRINMRTEKRNQKNRKRMFNIGTIAASLLIVFLAGTAPGHATIERIKDFFLPEKPIVEEIEGMKEEKNVQLQESKYGYVIYFDETVYKLEELEGKDRILPMNQAANYPEVYMEIQQVEDKNIETSATEIQKELKDQYEIVMTGEEVLEPVKGILLYAQAGNEWDDEVLRYYIVDNTQGGSFIIKQQFFVEASEGHGVRFDNMLKEFQIVKLQE